MYKDNKDLLTKGLDGDISSTTGGSMMGIGKKIDGPGVSVQNGATKSVQSIVNATLVEKRLTLYYQ